jgi:hypothetical protein
VPFLALGPAHLSEGAQTKSTSKARSFSTTAAGCGTVQHSPAPAAVPCVLGDRPIGLLATLIKTYTNIKEPRQVEEVVSRLQSIGISSHEQLLDLNTDQDVWEEAYLDLKAAWLESAALGQTALKQFQLLSLKQLWSRLRRSANA